MPSEHPRPLLATALSRGPAPFPELAARYLEEYLAKISFAVEHMSYHTGQILYLLKQSLQPGAERVELYPQHRGE